MRRAQFEIMGLAIVVLIVSVAIFYILGFMVRPDVSIQGEFQDQQFRQNLLDALLKTSLEGCEGTIADYLTVQALGQNLRPRISTESPWCASEDGKQEIINYLSLAVTSYMGAEYLFQVRIEPCLASGADCGEMVINAGNCAFGPGLGAPGRQVISKYPDPDPAEVVLWTCIRDPQV